MALSEALVTREALVSPPERFVSVSDEELLTHFQGEWMGADLNGMCGAAHTRSLRQSSALPCAARAGLLGAAQAPTVPILHRLVEGIVVCALERLGVVCGGGGHAPRHSRPRPVCTHPGWLPPLSLSSHPASPTCPDCPVHSLQAADFTALRRRLQADFHYFGAAALGRGDVPQSERGAA